MNKIIKWIRKEIGVTGYILIPLFVILFIWGYLQKKHRKEDAVYVKGIIIGKSRGARGNRHVDYYFYVNGKKIKRFVPDSFCKECDNCCDPGDTVIVRYEKGNPDNNDLVHEIPK